MTDADLTSPGLRERKKDEVRTRIVDALIGLMAEGRLDISHDLVAECAGIARRTVYRYFPDRETLLQAAWERVNAHAGNTLTFPGTMQELLDTMPGIYGGFDRIAPLATLIRSTPQGRAIRLSQNKRRVRSYTAATKDVVAKLPQKDRLLATAVLQMLHTTPWLEMRDHWGLSGAEIARAMDWVVRAVLDDLDRRGGQSIDVPLGEGAGAA